VRAKTRAYAAGRLLAVARIVAGRVPPVTYD
jgi:hypothetical protein